MIEVLIPTEQIDCRAYYFPSGDEITDVRRKLGVWLNWNYLGLLGGFFQKEDGHTILLDFDRDDARSVYVCNVKPVLPMPNSLVVDFLRKIPTD